ncbi:MAG: hypothetical protein ACE37H_11745 [Phycisphaeraceae bacterium]
MKTTTATLIAALFAVGPAFADPGAPQQLTVDAAPAAAAPLGEEAATDIEIINGVPVNPELKARIMESEDARTVGELLDLTHEVLKQQQAQLAEQQKQDDSAWMGQDPLGHLEGEMSDLVGDIDQSRTGEDTQAQGKEVVRKMDVLIAMMEKACSACSSCSGGGSGQGQNQANGNNPADQSTLAQGPGGSGELNAAGTGNNQFGDLDPEQRDAILRAQENQQGFPAEYDALLAEYYARLASERALESEDAAGDE